MPERRTKEEAKVKHYVLASRGVPGDCVTTERLACCR